MTNEAKIAAIIEFIADAEEALTDPCVIANEAEGSRILGEAIRESIADAKRQIAALGN